MALKATSHADKSSAILDWGSRFPTPIFIRIESRALNLQTQLCFELKPFHHHGALERIEEFIDGFVYSFRDDFVAEDKLGTAEALEQLRGRVARTFKDWQELVDEWKESAVNCLRTAQSELDKMRTNAQKMESSFTESEKREAELSKQVDLLTLQLRNARSDLSQLKQREEKRERKAAKIRKLNASKMSAGESEEMVLSRQDIRHPTSKASSQPPSTRQESKASSQPLVGAPSKPKRRFSLGTLGLSRPTESPRTSESAHAQSEPTSPVTPRRRISVGSISNLFSTRQAAPCMSAPVESTSSAIEEESLDGSDVPDVPRAETVPVLPVTPTAADDRLGTTARRPSFFKNMMNWQVMNTSNSQATPSTSGTSPADRLEEEANSIDTDSSSDTDDLESSSNGDCENRVADVQEDFGTTQHFGTTPERGVQVAPETCDASVQCDCDPPPLPAQQTGRAVAACSADQTSSRPRGQLVSPLMLDAGKVTVLDGKGQARRLDAGLPHLYGSAESTLSDATAAVVPTSSPATLPKQRDSSLPRISPLARRVRGLLSV